MSTLSGITQSVVLTDQEVIAIAARRGRTWNAALPTVRPDAAGLGDGALWGLRSLARRGLLEPGSTSATVRADLAELVEPAFGVPRLVAYLASASAPLVLAGAEVLVYEAPGTGGVLVELVRGLGSHEISLRTREDAISMLAELARKEVARPLGLAGVPDDLTLYVATSLLPGAAVVAFAPGTTSHGSFDGAGVVLERFEPGTVDLRLIAEMLRAAAPR